VAGRAIVVTSWVTVAVFAVIVIPDALGVHAFDDAAVVLSLVFFLGSLPIWFYAYALGVTRTARGDDVTVSGLFFLTGSAPTDVRRHLLGALAVCIVIVVGTAAENPFSVLVPMLPLGFAGLWGARHGTYAPRPAKKKPTGGRR
jgi:hypothetical protein